MSEFQYKQHAPTERRLQQATEQNNIRRSADLPKAAAIVLALALMPNNAARIGGEVSAMVPGRLGQADTGSPCVAIDWTKALEQSWRRRCF